MTINSCAKISYPFSRDSEASRIPRLLINLQYSVLKLLFNHGCSLWYVSIFWDDMYVIWASYNRGRRSLNSYGYGHKVQWEAKISSEYRRVREQRLLVHVYRTSYFWNRRVGAFFNKKVFLYSTALLPTFMFHNVHIWVVIFIAQFSVSLSITLTCYIFLFDVKSIEESVWRLVTNPSRSFMYVTVQIVYLARYSCCWHCFCSSASENIIL